MRFFSLLFAIGLLIQACASSNGIIVNPTPVEDNGLTIPSGVDSSIAEMANLLADSSFVSWEDETTSDALKSEGTTFRSQSDSLWAILELAQDTADLVMNIDSTQFISAFNEGAEYYIELQRISSLANPGSEQIALYASLVDQAILSFEKALTFNPFDAQTRVLLAQLYSVKAGRLNQEENFEKSIALLEKLSRLEKGDHVIFGVLAENYFVLNRYEESALNYRKAANVLLESGKLTELYYREGTYTLQDSVDVFTYFYYEGQSYLQRLDEIKSKEAFVKGYEFASSEEYKEIIQGEITFIDWDSGNIRASFARDSLMKLSNAGQPSNALEGYRELVPTLRSQRATDEIDWRIAILEYELGNTLLSAELLQTLNARIELQGDGSAKDSTYQQYLEDYGIITFNIGQENLNQRKRRLALTYLLQSGEIHWEYRGRAWLRVANLLQNNIPESLKYAHMAEEEFQNLEPDEQKSLLELFINLYRRNGDMNKAREYYAKWIEL